jgi:hypothetical protein
MMSRFPCIVTRYMDRNSPDSKEYYSRSSKSPMRWNSETNVRFSSMLLGHLWNTKERGKRETCNQEQSSVLVMLPSFFSFYWLQTSYCQSIWTSGVHECGWLYTYSLHILQVEFHKPSAIFQNLHRSFSNLFCLILYIPTWWRFCTEQC